MHKINKVDIITGTLSSANFTESNILLKEHTQVIKN